VRSRLSIFSGLVLWFTAAGVLIVAAISFFLFRRLDRYQLSEQNRTLALTMHQVVTGLASAEDDEGEGVRREISRIRQSLEAENASRPRSKLGIAVREGNRMLLSVGFVPALKELPPPASDLSQPPVAWHDPKTERHFLLRSATVNRGGRHYLIGLSLDQTQRQEALDDFRANTYIALCAGAPLLALAGAFVARRAMLPLARITAVTQRVDAGRLDHQLEGDTWPAELRTLAAEFAQMQVRLRESFQRLAQFSDDLAHELRTPVHNLMGAAEVTLSQPRSTEEYQETLASMLEEAQRLRRMIDELLFLARAEHPERALERVALEAREEAMAVVEFFAALAAEKRITLAIEGGGTVFADRALLRRALSNLVANALEHTPPGGCVRIVAAQDGASTRLAVHDTGAGIDSKHLACLFDRFYRADEARSGPAAGVGLGLSIVRSIMTLHGGTVTVSSELGRASVFTLRFPPADPSR
jgi:two-component system heavy metal sensor histidine kinase CusS